MKKIIICLCCFVVLTGVLCSCMSSSAISKSKEVVYQEYESSELRSENQFQKIANAGAAGIKLNNAEVDKNGSYYVNGIKVDSILFEEKHHDLAQRVEDNRKYTVYLKVKIHGDFWNGYTYSAVLENIENLRSVQEITEEKAKLEQEKIAKEESDRKAAEEQKRIADQSGKEIAEGYVYHGIDEAKQNAKLFDSGALEEGNAYFIRGYMVYAGGAMGGAIVSIFTDPHYHYVEYKNQKVKGEVVGAGQTFLGAMTISVIVAGGKAPVFFQQFLD